MSNMSSTPPSGYHTVTPRLIVDDVPQLVSFLRATFDATGEVVKGRPVELVIGDSLVMVSSTTERNAMPGCLYVYVDDADERFRRAVAAGAVTIEEPFDTPYGDRRAMVWGPGGCIFQIAHRG